MDHKPALVNFKVFYKGSVCRYPVKPRTAWIRTVVICVWIQTGLLWNMSKSLPLERLCFPSSPICVSCDIYIYIYMYTYVHTRISLWRCGPTRAMASSFFRFLDHTQRRITVGRTPLDASPVRRRDLYLTKHNTHNRQTPMPPVRFEPTVSTGERP